MSEVLSFNPKGDEPALSLRCLSDSLAIDVKIDFVLNSPVGTPTKEAVDEVIVWAAIHYNVYYIRNMVQSTL